MKPAPQTFSVAIPGAWNPAIINPDWLQKNVLKDSKGEWKVMLPLGDPTLPAKVQGDGLEFTAGPNRLDIAPTEPTYAGLQKALDAAAGILDVLSHTPVAACGVNFGFQDEEREFKTESLIEFNDSSKFEAEKYELVGTSITRTYKLSQIESTRLNLTIRLQSESIFSFNFHTDSTDPTYIANHLRKVDVEQLKSVIEDIVKNIYSCTLGD